MSSPPPVEECNGLARSSKNEIAFFKGADRLARVAAVFSILALILKTWELGIGPISSAIIDRYDSLIVGLSSYLSPLISGTLKYIGMRITLNNEWLHVFILMWIYMSAHVYSARYGKVDKAVWWYGGFGLFIAAVFSIGFGMTDPVTSGQAISLSVIPIVGYVAYMLGNALRAAILYAPNGHKLRSFLRSSRHGIRLLIWGAAIIIAAHIYNVLSFEMKPGKYTVMVLLLFVLSLAIYRIFVNQSWGRYDSAEPGSHIHNAIFSREAHIGWAIIISILFAMIFLAIGVGENFLLQN